MLHILHNGLLRIHYTSINLSKMVDEEGGSGCRCLYTLERNHIQHTLVPFMSYSRDDRQREVCHILSKRQGVETREIARCTTASDDDHAIKLLPFGIDTVKGSNHALLYPPRPAS